MNKYLVIIRLKGRIIKTAMQAENTIHARLIAEWLYGVGSVVSTPMKLAEHNISATETPEQAKIKTLQAQAERAKQAVKAERARQKIKTGQKQLTALGNNFLT